MKTLQLTGLLLSLACFSSLAPAQTKAPAPVAADEQAWLDLETKLRTPPARDKAAAKTEALQRADQAKAFHQRFPQHPKAIEARKFEAILLIDAAADAPTRARMETAVRAFREDPSVPAFDRAVVTGTYGFSAAGRRSRSQTEARQEFETVARSLIAEFPDQPQGYVSLLTQSSRRDGDAARAMVQEVLDAPAAPEEARDRARRLLNRLKLVGRPVREGFGGLAIGPGGKGGWPEKRAGIIYFWASWSEPSLALGERLAARDLAKGHVIGVCVDADHAKAAAAAAARHLPGELIYAPHGLISGLAFRLGADGAPLVYLVGADGRFADVRGLHDLEPKLAALGL